MISQTNQQQSHGLQHPTRPLESAHLAELIATQLNATKGSKSSKSANTVPDDGKGFNTMFVLIAIVIVIYIATK
jgi:hypothetical protein